MNHQHHLNAHMLESTDRDSLSTTHASSASTSFPTDTLLRAQSDPVRLPKHEASTATTTTTITHVAPPQSAPMPTGPPSISVIPQSNFGPIAQTLASPMDNNMNFMALLSPNGYYSSLTSPMTMNNMNHLSTMNMFNATNTNNHHHHHQTLNTVDPLTQNLNNAQMAAITPGYNVSSDWQAMMNQFNFAPMTNNNNNTLDLNNLNGFGQMPSFEIPPDLKNTPQITGLEAQPINTEKKKRGRKRKIKVEDSDDDNDYNPNDDDFVVQDTKPKKKRGRKPKNAGNRKLKSEDESLEALLNKANDKIKSEPGFVGIKNTFGEVRICIPPKLDDSIKYSIFGHACTEKIEDILQPKKRTRYVRGLNTTEKKDRRREQNRNAAARSRARKNAMIAKVIQLHQENLALRAHVSSTIKEMKLLEEEKRRLEMDR